MLTIKTLGEFDVLLNGVSLLNGTDVRRGLLLIYLWEKRTPQPRHEVARLLWPWGDHDSALVNLRAFLLRLRREGLEEYLDADRNTLALINREKISYDAAQVRALTIQIEQTDLSDLAAVADLHRGAFLENVILDEYPELGEWVGAVRAEIEIRIVQTLSMLVARGVASGYAEMVLGYAEKLVALTPYNDESLELYLLALARAGRVSEMLNRFHHYKRRLKEEMNIEQPGQRLIDLVERLKSPQIQAAAQIVTDLSRAEEVLGAEESVVGGNYHFPHIEQPLIGREAETLLLQSLLGEGSRLITVLGIGGTGKTFFVRSQYTQLQTDFGDAVYYVDLRSAAAQGEQASNLLLLSIATSLDLKLQPGIPLFNQVVAVLQRTKCCLILDNFETVQSAAPVVQELLKSTAQLTILVTSRERLNLSMEALISLGGLSQRPGYTGVVDATNLQSGLDDESAAVRYFIQCAQRQDIRYTIDAEKRLWIEKICRQVDALPLAIELTAMQLPFYSLQELTEQIGVNHAVLTADVGDLPGDHYSVWAVLDSMWQTLDDDERRVLTELTVFAGVFHREAMMAVAPAPRRAYLGLINASLLRTEDPAWFSLHPLVKQYAAQRLPHDTPARQRHSNYFLKFFEGRDRIHEDLAYEPEPLPALVVRCGVDTIVAWRCAVAESAWEVLDLSLYRFVRYLIGTQQIEECNRLMALAIERLPSAEQRNLIHHRVGGRAALFLGVNATDSHTAKWFEYSLLWLQATGDAWDTAACAISYANTMLGRRMGQWDRIEAVLVFASDLVETHDLKPLKILLHISLCAYYVQVGAWRQARETQALLVPILPEHLSTFLAMTLVMVHLLNLTLMDDWQGFSWLLERLESAPVEPQTRPWLNQWTKHFRSYLLAEQGDLAGAIELRKSILDDYVSTSQEVLLPVAYTDLVLWYIVGGDVVAAKAAAESTYFHLRRDTNIPMVQTLGWLGLAVYHLLCGETETALSILHKVLALRKEVYDLGSVFVSLYLLVQVHRERIPAELYLRIIKIGGVSPVMLATLRPYARIQLAMQQLDISDEERQTLWATDAAAVEILAQEVTKLVL